MRPNVEYKNSGISWIRDIPKDWQIKKVKYLFNVYNGATPSTSNPKLWNGSIIWVTPADYKTGDMYITSSRKKITKEGINSCGTVLVPNGSIIISNRAPIGTVAMAKTELCTNQGCKSLVKKSDIVEKYYLYFFMAMKEPLNMLGKGTTFLELSNYELSNFIVPYPNLSIQQRIAEYLDCKTLAIEQVISEKEKLIELLKEKRQAIICNSVLRGLHSNINTKNSGVEWIGEIPEKWEIVKFKYCFNTTTGISITRSELGEEGVHCIGYGPIHSRLGFDLDLKRDELTKAPYEFFESKKSAIASENDFIFCDTSEDIDGSGNNVYVKDLDGNDLLAGSHTILARPIRKFESRFLAYLFSTKEWRSQIQSRVFGVKVYSITQQILNSTYVVLPSIEEQKEIIGYLDSKISMIDSVVNDIIIQVDKLKEYRQSIISEAVTGKVVV